MYVHYQFAHVIYTQMHIFYLHGDFWENYQLLE